MKVLYLDTKSKKKIILSETEIASLPKKLVLAYTIQYKDSVQDIKDLLEKNKIHVVSVSQVLGCTQLNTKHPVLLIGSGLFHAKNLYLQCPEIYVLEGRKVIKIPRSEIESVAKKRKTALLKYLHAENVGILVTTKPGQENLKLAKRLKKKIQSQGKNVYLFLSNNIDVSQFENFAIDCFVNTACLGLFNDNTKIINYAQIPKN
ncbi:2-(3-amino-3-carboxypropyl)histidine synthase [Candidatus Pacearchaeota archaeon]|nr:2-(3-amino-3-carboxypropyl)histidine synthase [Candidatus Pacearchaeota archaeon]